ncbi:hypothetical protein JXA34_00400 [Patescibacteria group bacterium]|nr:hypothetical protein [Patescibacteria group bacterium]
MVKSLVFLLIGIPLLSVVTLFSYKNFLNYKPKILKRIEEVKGIKDDNQFHLPYPRGSQKIGFSKTSEGEQVTFQTNLNLAKLREFYNSVFYEKGWQVETETVEDTFMIMEFKSKYTLVTIKSTLQPDLNVSIVTIKTSNR